MSRRRRLRNDPTLILALALAASLPRPGRGDDPQPATPPGPTVPSDPVFEVLRIDGTTVNGRIRSLGPDGTLVLEGPGAPGPIALREVVALGRLDGDPPPAVPEGGMVLFPDGDRLGALIDRGVDEALEVRPAALGDAPTSIPLDRMLGLVLSPPADPDAREALLTRVRDEPRDAEVLWLTNGDRLSGSLLALGAETVEFQPETGRVAVPRGGVTALGFDPNLVDYPRPDGTSLELSFLDGSRLGVSGPRIEPGTLRGTTRYGAEVRVPLSALWRAHVLGGASVFLSERPADAADHVGYLGRHPGRYGRDRTWDGHTLSLGGRPYRRGIGTLPRTLLAYRLEPGRDRRFQALVGLDDRSGERGNVVFRVLVDGKERFASPPLTRRDDPLALDVDLSGGRLLILVTEFGEGGDVQDSADWVEARLIR